MSISDKKTASGGNMPKTVFIYLGASAFCVLFDRIYALFGHGVFSAAMSFMFLYPLCGGAMLFLALWRFFPLAAGLRLYRMSYNSYNSGIAALTVSSALKGVFDIAGTSSSYLTAFNAAGFLMAVLGVGAAIYSALAEKDGSRRISS